MRDSHEYIQKQTYSGCAHPTYWVIICVLSNVSQIWVVSGWRWRKSGTRRWQPSTETRATGLSSRWVIQWSKILNHKWFQIVLEKLEAYIQEEWMIPGVMEDSLMKDILETKFQVGCCHNVLTLKAKCI